MRRIRFPSRKGRLCKIPLLPPCERAAPQNYALSVALMGFFSPVAISTPLHLYKQWACGWEFLGERCPKEGGCWGGWGELHQCATNLTSGKWIREGIRGAMSCFSDGQHRLGGKMGPACCSRCPVQLFSTSAGASRCGGELAQHLRLGLRFPIPVGRGDSFPFYICLGWERLSCWHYSAPF